MIRLCRHRRGLHLPAPQQTCMQDLVSWVGEPHIDRVNGDMKCDAWWCNPVGGARKWFTLSDPIRETVVVAQNVVDPDVAVEQIGPGNMPPAAANRRECLAKKAAKVDDACHLLITDEMERRDQLDFDPGAVWMEDESDDEEEEEQ